MEGNSERKEACGNAAAAPSISFENICLSFNGSALFKNLNFEVEAGLCTCILGPSGCGKSTLLKLISGNPSLTYTGRIRFSGGKRQDHKAAWMAQNDLLMPWMRIIDNVLLGATLRAPGFKKTVSEALRKKAAALLIEAGLGGYEQAYPSALSGGMRQRVALLRTLMEDRQVLLMDEPFSALDALTRIRLQNLAAGMIKGATVLLVTHDPMEALRMGDRIHVMSGTPVQMGSVLHLPGNPPRDAGDPQTAGLYAGLLKRLMGEVS